MNAANYLGQNILAPGMITALYSYGNYQQFGLPGESSSSLPLPTQLNGVQVLFNGAPVPLFYAGPLQINFQVPIGAPQTGTADLQVTEVATGRILGDITVNMTTALPGIFTQAANGSGSAIATNEDGTLNTQTNPAIAGHVITLYCTGQGYIAGAPADGSVSGTALSTPQLPEVFIGYQVQTGSAIQYSGLAPTLVGVWQINVTIPSDAVTLPTSPTERSADLQQRCQRHRLARCRNLRQATFLIFPPQGIIGLSARIVFRALVAFTLLVMFLGRVSGGRLPVLMVAPFYYWFLASVFVFAGFGIAAAVKAWREPVNRRAYLFDIVLAVIWIPYWMVNLR